MLWAFKLTSSSQPIVKQTVSVTLYPERQVISVLYPKYQFAREKAGKFRWKSIYQVGLIGTKCGLFLLFLLSCVFTCSCFLGMHPLESWSTKALVYYRLAKLTKLNIDSSRKGREGYIIATRNHELMKSLKQPSPMAYFHLITGHNFCR